ncbi:hypothetical protein IPL85_05790 [Candidatus Saccharibacteria bacterium]|nr:MAG: hypothetical protein IPL85_05790 [Candidatus Saccharibacteria bacterium]
MAAARDAITYVEVLDSLGASVVRNATSYIEVLDKPITAVRNATTYVEVLTVATLQPGFIGWGLPIVNG